MRGVEVVLVRQQTAVVPVVLVAVVLVAVLQVLERQVRTSWVAVAVAVAAMAMAATEVLAWCLLGTGYDVRSAGRGRHGRSGHRG
jgi:Flp pilus assembly pilin Flp